MSKKTKTVRICAGCDTEFEIWHSRAKFCRSCFNRLLSCEVGALAARARIREGWTFERAVTTPNHCEHSKTRDALAAADAAGIKNRKRRKLILARVVDAGWTIEDAIRCGPRERRVPLPWHPMWARGHRSKVKIAAEAAGFKWATIYNRMRHNGMSLEEALRTPLKHGIAKAARARGLSPSAVYSRMESGCTLDEALAIPPQGESLRKRAQRAAVAAGLEPCQIRVVSGRIDNGLSIEQAISKPFRVGSSNLRRSKYGGLPYGAISALARDRGMSSRTLQLRLQNGWSLEDALVKKRTWRRAQNVSLTLRSKQSVTKGIEFSREQKDTFWYLVSKGLPYHANEPLAQQVRDTWSALKALMPTTQISAMVPNYSGIARQHGIKPTTFHARVKSGMSPTEALLPRPKSLKQKCREIGVSYPMVLARVGAGESFESAVSRPKVTPTERGQRRRDDDSVAGKLRAAGWTRSTSPIYMKLKTGMTVGEAIAATAKNKPHGMIRPHSLSGSLRLRGFTKKERTTIIARVKRQGLSIEDAIKFKYNRRVPRNPNSIAALAKTYNIGVCTVHHRMKKMGMTLQQALSCRPYAVRGLNL